MVKVNFGCGKHRMSGYIGVDIVPLRGVVDLVCDFRVIHWPIKDSSIDECMLSNIIEHLSNTVEIMEELYRICKNSALIYITVPYYNSPGAFQDPTHKSYFTEKTFDYFTGDNETPLSEYNYYSKARFEIISFEFYQRRILKLLPMKIQLLFAHHLATVHAIKFILKVIK